MEQIPKKESGMQRIIGVGENEEALLKFFKSRFNKDIEEPAEREKSQELESIIRFISGKIKEILWRRYNIAALDIEPKHFHIIDRSKLTPEQLEQLNKKFEHTRGFFDPATQQIGMLIDYEDNKLKFLQTLVHEIFHANSFQSSHSTDDPQKGIRFRIKNDISGEEESVSLGQRRQGFSVYLKDGANYFRDFDEAIITELAIKFEDSYFRLIPELQDQLLEKYKALETESKRTGESPDDLKNDIATVQNKKLEDGSQSFFVTLYAYREERKKLRNLIADLYLKNKDRFSSEKDIAELFIKACLTGKMLPIARLIEKTYGKGSFRKLGKETRDKRYDKGNTAR